MFMCRTAEASCRMSTGAKMWPAHYAAAVRVLGLAVAAAALLAAACRCAADSGCMPELVSLSPCMDYMSGNASTPDGPCCSAVSRMLSSSPGCLCTVVLGATPASLGVAVDGARVPQLPVACKVQAPPASNCNATGVVTPSPAAPGAPAAAPPSDAEATPAGSGSKATPTSTLPSSDGSTTGRPGTAFVFAAAALTFLHRF